MMCAYAQNDGVATCIHLTPQEAEALCYLELT